MRNIYLLLLILIGTIKIAIGQEKNLQGVEIITSDIDNFWNAYDSAKPEFNPDIFQKLYFDIGSPGLKNFIKDRIKSSKNLSMTILKRPLYYESIRESTLKIRAMEREIKSSFSKLKDLYPRMRPPKIYFVIGVMNSGGTGFNDGLIIGAEMFALTTGTPEYELTDRLKKVLKPVEQIPHIVAHELVHNFQNYDGGTLLAACIKEGGADYIAELISGDHINQHVHDYANPREKELCIEFKERMLKDDYDGWLYSSSEGRPNDLGYWMGYKITKAYFENEIDKKKAMNEYLNIKDFEQFLAKSKYFEKIDK